MLELDDELKKQVEDAESKKQWLNVAGSVLQNFADIPSSYELLKGKSMGRPDVKGSFKAVADTIGDPLEKQKKAYDYLNQKRSLARAEKDDAYTDTTRARETRLNEETDALTAMRKDPKSARSIAARAAYQKAGLDVGPGDTDFDLESRYGALADYAKMGVQEKAKARERAATQAFEREKMQTQLNQDMAKLGVTQAFDTEKQGRQFGHDKEMQGLRGEQEAKIVNMRGDQEMKLKQMAEAVQAQKAKMDPKKAAEFDNRYRTIMNEIARLEGMVDKDGTYEMIGPHNKNLDQSITSIAVDAAKLFDPESVARESEVAQQKGMLFEPGSLTTRNETAKKTLENYKRIIQDRARAIRGDAAPAMSGDGATQTVQHPQTNQAVEWAKANLQDPRAAEILKRNGIDPATMIGAR